jgi:Immunity protein 63
MVKRYIYLGYEISVERNYERNLLGKKVLAMEKLLTLKEIEVEVNHLAGLIAAPKDLLPTYGYSRDFAYPHIEVDQSGYHYVIIERGQELDRRSTGDMLQLLYWVFESVTFSLAIDYELKNRIENQDFRRIAFAKQEEFLAILNPEWAERQKIKHLAILQKHPFDDLAGLRATYCCQLRK